MTKTILLADDSVTIQKVVELTFMDEDFHVTAVSNGAEAIARLGETRPDVVITDVHMPGANGFEVCRRSKELYPAVPVLLLVGTFEGFDADEAVRCGADGHLKKPFDSQELMRRVRELASAPSRSVPVPPATPDFASFAVPAEAAVSATGSASDAAPELAADDIYALPTPAEDLWEPIAEEIPVQDSPGMYAPAESLADTATRFVAVQSTPEALPPGVSSYFEAAEPAGAALAPVAAAGAALSDADIDRIARRMVELVGDKAVRDVAWEVVPDLAEVLLKSRIRELESSID
ncbi:MAG: response regulator [Thermoanaerobaculia bacterium]|nr:response regulator [Thermoanaerobaculia bacterium]MBP9826620.1 response regulator [Thermoanaerobaculia bacterium]